MPRLDVTQGPPQGKVRIVVGIIVQPRTSGVLSRTHLTSHTGSSRVRETGMSRVLSPDLIELAGRHHHALSQARVFPSNGEPTTRIRGAIFVLDGGRKSGPRFVLVEPPMWIFWPRAAERQQGHMPDCNRWARGDCSATLTGSASASRIIPDSGEERRTAVGSSGEYYGPTRIYT